MMIESKGNQSSNKWSELKRQIQRLRVSHSISLEARWQIRYVRHLKPSSIEILQLVLDFCLAILAAISKPRSMRMRMSRCPIMSLSAI